MKPAVLILGVLILFLLAGVIPAAGGVPAGTIYYSPVFILLLFLLSFLSIRCCLRRKISWKQSGFYLVHLAAVLILAGAFAGYLFGIKGLLQLPVGSSASVDHLPLSGREPVPFGFTVAAEDFQVLFYPPVYQLCRAIPPEEMAPGKMPFKPEGKFSANQQGVCIVNGFGPVFNLWNESRQEWVQRKALTDDSFLYRTAQTPSFFGVTLVFDGEKHPVRINHPARFNGWRFYLMSYDRQNQSTVQLSARHDPGRTAVIAGIWLMLAGTFILCFRREGASP
ncbi:MAG: cytochrome c biogenesis protein ResB [Pontiellaceae bacterium]|nr:cytochrome c biogenesis protein ResB [Pontiellaceae bacterium]